MEATPAGAGVELLLCRIEPLDAERTQPLVALRTVATVSLAGRGGEVGWGQNV